MSTDEKVAVDPPPRVLTAHEEHMARAERGVQHAKPKKPKGPLPGTHAQKHPKDEHGRFRHK